MFGEKGGKPPQYGLRWPPALLINQYLLNGLAAVPAAEREAWLSAAGERGAEAESASDFSLNF